MGYDLVDCCRITTIIHCYMNFLFFMASSRQMWGSVRLKNSLREIMFTFGVGCFYCWELLHKTKCHCFITFTTLTTKYTSTCCVLITCMLFRENITAICTHSNTMKQITTATSFSTHILKKGSTHWEQLTWHWHNSILSTKRIKNYFEQLLLYGAAVM